MKKDAVLIQASRGGIVDEQALADSLRAGHLGGAAVDVFSTEPPAPDNPLFTLDGEAAQPPAADAAHRRRDPPVGGVPVPLGVAECRARAGRKGAAPLHRAY